MKSSTSIFSVALLARWKSNASANVPSKRSLSGKPSTKNIYKLREKTLSNVYPKGFVYKPAVSEKFLEEWLDFPTDCNKYAFYNCMRLPYIWLLHTTKAMAGLDPSSNTIRERLSNQSSILGTAAGLFLVIAVAGYLAPPKATHAYDQLLIDIYGVMMFTATMGFTMYIGLSLTNLYPLVQSLRDDIAFDAFEVYSNRWGGFELYLFNIGFQFILFSLLIVARVLYSDLVQYVLIFVFFCFYGVVVFLSKEMFLSFDPITSMHLGLSSDPNDMYRAEMMSHYILNKIPNHIIDGPLGPDDHTSRVEDNGVFTEFPHTPEELHAQQPRETGSGIVSALIKKSNKAAQEVQKLHSNKSSAENKSKKPSSGNVMPFDDSHLIDLENQPDVSPSVREMQPSTRIRQGARFTSYSAPSSDGTQCRAWETDVCKAVCGRVEEDCELVEMDILPSLESIFKGTLGGGEESYLLKDTHLARKDSLAALDRLKRGGCETSEDVVLLLNETKGLSRCTCRRPTGRHADDCSSRQSGLWLSTLVGLGIPAFHALKILKYFKQFLK